MFPRMEITWRKHHAGQSHRAWNDEGYIVGEVVAYGQQLRADAGSQPTYWVGFARRERLPGQFATLDDAERAVERALSTA
jgi:hypothetical protein